MTDEFNLVPTNNLEKHLDNILRAASGEEPQYDLAPNWRIEQYLDAIQKALSGGGGLPPVTASDAGKVATVDDSGVWGAQEPIGKKFIVTLTPTALDYSGTMDKTVSEINAAYEAGREIVARIVIGNGLRLEAPLNGIEVDDESSYPGFRFQMIYSNSIIVVWTGTMDDGTYALYATNIYTLTPAT